ncbi:helix-turn-helix domain-containing protein [Nocardia sp. NPDC003482]
MRRIDTSEHGLARIGVTVPRRELGRLLRDLRLGAGLTMVHVAQLIGKGTTTVQRMETAATVTVDPADVEKFCQICGADDTTTEALKVLARQPNSEVWVHKYGELIPRDFDFYSGLESTADGLTSYQDQIPKILQAPEYARTLVKLAHRNESDHEIARRVERRMRRKLLITRKYNPIRYRLVLDESAARRAVGNARVMFQQCAHLADMSTRPNISVRILPDSAGMPLGVRTGPFSLLDFETQAPGEHSVVHIAIYRRAIYLHAEADLREYRASFLALEGAALSPEESRKLLRQTARTYRETPNIIPAQPNTPQRTP